MSDLNVVRVSEVENQDESIQYEVAVLGVHADDWDVEFYDSEQTANLEAEGIAEEIGAVVEYN